MANNTLRSLDVLIKIEKEKVEKILKERDKLSRDIALMTNERQHAEEQLRRECAFEGDIPAFMMLSHYTKAMRDKINDLSEKIQKKQYQKILLQGELSSLYATMKTYEILRRMKKEGIDKLHLKNEQKNMDEVGLHKFLFHGL